MDVVVRRVPTLVIEGIKKKNGCDRGVCVLFISWVCGNTPP